MGRSSILFKLLVHVVVMKLLRAADALKATAHMHYRVVMVITCDEGKDGAAQVGRTGRAGRPGRVTSLYTHQQAPLAEAIRCPGSVLHHLRCTIPSVHPLKSFGTCIPRSNGRYCQSAVANLQAPAKQVRTNCFLVRSCTPVRGPDLSPPCHAAGWCLSMCAV